LSELKQKYDEAMLHQERARYHAEKSKQAFVELGELIEKQGAKNADHDRAS
jgi:hypothetical protein